MQNTQNGDPYNRGGFIAFIFSMVFSLAFFIYIALIHPGVDLKEVPDEATQGGPPVVQAANPGDVDVDVSKIANPWEENVDMVAHGAFVYKNNCAVCHGPKGLGDGPAGGALVPPPRNFVEGKWKVGGDSIALFHTLQVGIEGTSMASFKTLPSKDRWALVQFIRSITKNKTADDPAKLAEFGKTAE